MIHESDECDCVMCQFATEQEARSASGTTVEDVGHPRINGWPCICAECVTKRAALQSECRAFFTLARFRSALFDILDEGDHDWPWTFPLSETQTATDARVRFVDAVEARLRGRFLFDF